MDWLETLPDLRPDARPELVEERPGFERWHGRGALGYLTLAAICDRALAERLSPARVVVAEDCFPTGALGYWARLLANGGYVALLTATSPPRLAHPDGGEPLVGTTPLAIGVPSAGGEPIVSDVSMGRTTYGDVLAGRASPEELVPFGGEHAHKAFALALGLQLAVESCVHAGYGTLLVMIAPRRNAVPALRRRATGLRLPGDARRISRPGDP